MWNWIKNLFSKKQTGPYEDEWGVWPKEYYDDKDYWR